MPSIKDKSTIEALARAFCSNGRKQEQAMIDVGYTPAYASSYCGVMWDNQRVQAAIARLDEKTAERLQITRETQLTDLEEAKQMSRDLKMPAAFVSACREQDNILGLIRDKAPNTEKIAEMVARMSDEEIQTRRIVAKIRTDELSDTPEPGLRLSKEAVA